MAPADRPVGSAARPWRDAALALVRPSADEARRARDAGSRLVERVREEIRNRAWPGTPLLVGSVAKDTFLHGQADLDCFVTFPADAPRGELERWGLELGRAVLSDPVIAYAEHPYVRGGFDGFEAEVVPCYALADARAIRSAVDRTPFHTEYVVHRLGPDGRDEVRLLKRFLATVDAYGAEAAVEGVSGYLAELLVLAFGSFEGVLRGLVLWDGRPVVLEGPPTRAFPGDALVVVDPVDATRNAAAAVSPATLARVLEAAAWFLRAPDARFFAVAPVDAWDAQRAREALVARGTTVVGVAFAPPREDIEDTRHARLRRAARLLARQLELEDCPVHGAAADPGMDGRAVLALELDASALAAPRLHLGPPVRDPDHAARFRSRWVGAPDAAGPVEERAGRLQVLRVRAHSTPAALVAAASPRVELPHALGTAAPLEVLDEDACIARVPAPVLTRLLDRRRPWETWGTRETAEAPLGR